MTTNDQLELWLRAPHERKDLEFKEAKNQYDNQKLFWHCVALANEGGGKLILGVTDQAPRTVVGTAAFHSFSQIISATQDGGLIKADEQAGGSRKFARYVPFWA